MMFSSIRNRPMLAIVVLLLIYAAIRIACVPTQPELTMGFGHDSAYLSMAAGNLIAGKGLVLDSLWLVFLQPASLPMPYHNANPLYPLFVAGFSRTFGTDVIRSSFLLGALSSVALIVALTWLLNYYLHRPGLSFALAFVVALFPEPWNSSWVACTDEVWCLLVVLMLGTMVRSESVSMALLTGVLLGMAWLTRGAAVILPLPIGAWMLCRFGWQKALSRGVLMSIACVVVSIPWLIHNYRTWGDPLRSDNGYLWATHAYYTEAYGLEPPRIWRMPATPERVGRLIREHPGVIARHWARNLIPFTRIILSGSTDRNIPALAILILLSGIFAFRYRSDFLTPEAAAFLAYIIGFYATLSVSGAYQEPRYLILGYLFFAVWLFYSLFRTLRDLTAVIDRSNAVSIAIAALGGVYFAGFLLPSAYAAASNYRSINTAENQPYSRAARRLNQEVIHGKPTVVGHHPYLYTMFTGAQSLSMPYASDTYLLAYMNKYKAPFILLSDQEQEYWRPGWKSGLPPGIVQLRRVGDYTLYGLNPADPANGKVRSEP